MEYTYLPNIKQKVSQVGLGTWAIGGWMWGGTDEKVSIAAIHQALDKGINLIDTAPVYGFGVSEEIVGKALKAYGKRDQIVLTTKVGLSWTGPETVFRDSRKETIAKEIEASLKRLQTDYIDLYLVHWPDTLTPFEETAAALKKLLDQGKIRAIGVCNFSQQQMEAFQKGGPLHVLESPFNLFEREMENKELAYCLQKKIGVLGYGSLCRGLLTSMVRAQSHFKGDDLRKGDPKFQEPHFSEYLACVSRLEQFAKKKYNRSSLSLAVRWSIDKGISVALWGVRKPEQLKEIDSIWGWKLSSQDLKEIDQILDETLKNPVETALMGPPVRK